AAVHPGQYRIDFADHWPGVGSSIAANHGIRQDAFRWVDKWEDTWDEGSSTLTATNVGYFEIIPGGGASLSGQITPSPLQALPIPPGDLKLRIQERLNFEDCAKYITQLINKVAELNPANPAKSTDIFSLYNDINTPPNSGFTFIEHLQVEGYTVSGLAEGSLANNNAAVRIAYVASYGPPNNYNLRHA